MIPAPRPSPRKLGSGRRAGETNIAYLRGVDTDSYADWESVYRDNVERLYRLMYTKVGNRPDAENLTSEVFRTALGPLPLAASKPEVRTSLLVTASTVLASHWRRRLGLAVTSIDPESDLSHLAEPTTPDPHTDTPEQANRVLALLPERYRRILELRFLETRSIKQAAQTMGISVSNAKVLQHRALRMATKLTADHDR